MANYTMHHLNVGSNTYEMVDEQGRANIAPSFSTSTAYAAGDYVIYGGKLYQFTSAHSGAWTEADAEECTVAEDISQLKEEISQLSGLSEEVKVALLQIAQKVAYVDEHGQDYYDDLYDALYPPADLVSISAVYTQSGTVYDTDSLDSLKSDLVVTAHMSDQTTRIVTTYTLSGTLTEGTSTITVAYGGKTTTFTVTVTEAPPYTFYDYLQGDGNAYINTGLLASTYFTLNYDHEIKAARYNAGDTKAIYGARQMWGAKNARQLWWNGSTGYGVNFCASSTTAVADASSKEVPITIKTTRDKKILRDGVEVSYTAGDIGSIMHTGPITLFAECTGGEGSGYKAIADTNAYAGAYSACRIYYFKVWDANGDLVADIKPALRISDNAIGMYDSVRNVFLENANDTGAFSLGNE